MTPEIDYPTSFSPKDRRMAQSILEAFGDSGVSREAAWKIRQELNQRRNQCIRERKHTESSLYASALWAVKLLTVDPIYDAASHPLSDHAFLRYLEREEGVIVSKLKDVAFSRIKEKGLERFLVYVDGKYVTFLPDPSKSS